MTWLKAHWKWVAAGAVALLIGGAVLASRKAPEAVVTTDTVKSGTLVQSVDATGDIESIDEVELSFESSGTVDTVLFSVGDDVKAGDILATVRAAEALADVQSAREAMRSAQGNLDQKLAGATSEEIAVAQAQISVARASRDAAQIAYDSAVAAQAKSIAVQTATVASARADIAEAESDEQTNNVEATADLVTTMRGSMIAVRSALSEADETLGINNTLANDSFEDVLSALDAQALIDATNVYREAIKSRDAAESVIFKLSPTAPAAEVDAAADLVAAAIENTALTLLYTRRVLDATSIDTMEFSFDDLSAAKASLDAERNRVQSEENAYEAAKQARDSALSSGAFATASANNAYALALARQSSELSSSEASVAAANASLTSRNADLIQAEASLAQVIATPRTVDLAALQGAVNQSRAALAAAEARLSKTAIVAPISGKLTRMDVKPGEPASPSQIVATVQTTEDHFQIVVDVAESDIAKVSLNDKADITFDAFGEDLHVPGSVQKINPAEKAVEGVVYYEVTVYLDETSISLGLKPGMSADVTIITSEIPNALFVPQRAVLERDGTKYVRVPQGDSFREQTVETGLRGDEGKLEIVSGLSEGETIIVSIRE